MTLPDPQELLEQYCGPGAETRLIAAPGRVNLIGEHIDYHGLAVLPMAMQRRVRVAFRARNDGRIRAVSGDGYGTREFEWTPDLEPGAAGDWENYLKAAARAVGRGWGLGCGVDAALVSDVPPAAGLSSSSAILVAFTLGLLWANRREASFEELMEVLPEGEQFGGTRGGGMDHAACLASRQGCASLIEFAPLSVRAVPVPGEWGFLVAHSLTTAEKSGAAREEFNARRTGGNLALARLGFASYREAIGGRSIGELAGLASAGLSSQVERDAFLHTTGEALRVQAAVTAMERGEAEAFGRLLWESHASARDLLKISCAALDRLVDAAMEAGALGARLTGAGFGGCAIVFCRKSELARVRDGLLARYYAGRPDFIPQKHLIETEPGAGALAPGLLPRPPSVD
ncbi:MAG: galactokinase family protein [Acidobacteriota bacterium]